MSVKCYVDKMEQVVIQSLKHFNINGTRTENTGIWVGNSKICAIGIHVQRYVTCHGFALNCNTDLSWFDHIVPCGLNGLGVTSISQQTQRNISIEDALNPILKSFETVFNCNISHKN